MADSPREKLAESLTEGFPEWKVVPSERVPDSLDRPTLVLKQRTIARLPEAPQSHYTVGYFVTVVDDHTDFDAAETALDENVLAVWEYLMSLSNVHPKTATKALFADAYLAYDIETDLTVQKG